METDHKWKFPPCFSCKADYELWLNTPLQENLVAQHCADCLPSFKMRMLKAGRCEHPETVFAFIPSSFDGEDGVDIEGRWSRSTEPRAQVIRMVRQVGRPRKQPPEPVKLDTKKQREEATRDWWAARHAALMEKLRR